MTSSHIMDFFIIYFWEWYLKSNAFFGILPARQFLGANGVQSIQINGFNQLSK
ncbi:hypothetical protein [Eubacterium callanderi]|uniref:hypothetical protein n=1 Tax=Eubacterium callanderi TaxID=53442 RepID=UPI0039964B58